MAVGEGTCAWSAGFVAHFITWLEYALADSSVPDGHQWYQWKVDFVLAALQVRERFVFFSHCQRTRTLLIDQKACKWCPSTIKW